MGFVRVVLGLCLIVSTGHAAVLKPYLVTDNETLRLSDIFQGLEKYAQVIVAPTPPPGQKKVFDAMWLKNIARQYQVDWPSNSGFETFTVERKGVAVELTWLEEQLLPLVREKLSLATGELKLDPYMNPIVVCDLSSAHVQLIQCTHDAKSEKIHLTFRINSNGSIGGQNYSMTGKIIHKVDVPVLTRDIRTGEIIQESDVALQGFLSHQIRPQTLTHPEDLIGHESNYRTLKAGVPILQNDLKIQYAIKMGTIITMVVRHRNLTVTAKGKAQNNAKPGESVSVINLESKKIVTGTAERNGTVRVELATGG
jgi:flagella basal body P-ring formation protein FlgA